MMYIFLGWLNVTLLAIMTSPYWLRFLNARLFHWKGGLYAKVLKFLRTVHKPLGAVILVIALIHEYLALGAFRLHTGTLLWTFILITAILGLTFYKTKHKIFFVWHKRMVVLSILLLLLHLLYPGAIYYLLN